MFLTGFAYNLLEVYVLNRFLVEPVSTEVGSAATPTTALTHPRMFEYFPQVKKVRRALKPDSINNYIKKKL